jgi:hypothetical protein
MLTAEELTTNESVLSIFKGLPIFDSLKTEAEFNRYAAVVLAYVFANANPDEVASIVAEIAEPLSKLARTLRETVDYQRVH